MTSLKKTAIRGTLWTLFSYGMSNVLRLVSNLILTSLLLPDLLGLMIVVNTISLGLNLFSDIGFGPNIIQNKRGEDPSFLNTAWTIQIIRGSILWLLCIILAFPVAHFYGQPELLWLLPIIGSTMFIASFQSTSIHLISRRMDFRRAELFSLLEQVVSIGVMLVWAYFSPTIWALVANAFAVPIIRLIWTHFLIPNAVPCQFQLEKEAVRELISFGKWVFFSTASTFLGMQADRLILGKLIPLSLLGVYGIALTFADMPRQIVAAISSKVLLPTFSKIADLPRWDMRMRLLRNRRSILLGAAMFLALVVGFGDLLVLTLYTFSKTLAKHPIYAQAAWMVPILALGIWPNLLHESIRQSLIAIGKPQYEAYGQFCKSLLVCIGVPLAYFAMGGAQNPQKGVLGAVLVVACNDIPLYIAIEVGLFREDLNSLKQDLQMTGILLSLLAVILSSRWLAGLGMPIQGLFPS